MVLNWCDNCAHFYICHPHEMCNAQFVGKGQVPLQNSSPCRVFMKSEDKKGKHSKEKWLILQQQGLYDNLQPYIEIIQLFTSDIPQMTLIQIKTNIMEWVSR